MENNRIIYLYERFNNRTASAEEVLEFHDALSGQDAERLIKNLIEEKWNSITADQLIDLVDHHIDPVFEEIIAQEQAPLQQQVAAQKRQLSKLWKGLAIAASLAVILSLGLLFYFGKMSSRLDYANITPGKRGATLTLSNGKTIVLSDTLNGKFAEETGVIITKAENGELVYQINDPAHASKETSKENTLTTAAGQTYQLRLPDGSKIWLNAASTLKYPASFTAAKLRKVKLIGEAYFEVAHNAAQPFVVESGKQRVEVLGTHFNINSYPDEKVIETTLMEGAVRVDALNEAGAFTKNASGIVLRPNQQAVLDQGQLSMHEVEAREFISWKDGKFSFDKEALSSIMRKVARWYNVTVIYQDPVGGVKLTGSISRFERVDKFLEMLERTKEVHFKIEDDKIIVMK